MLVERATALEMPTRSVRGSSVWVWPSDSIKRSPARNITDVCSNASRPASVSLRPEDVRVNSVMPSVRSSARSCSLTVGWVTCNFVAAAAIEPIVAVTWK